MEKTQKGEQFRILDPPRTPEKPISPNLRLILMACKRRRAGLGGGIISCASSRQRGAQAPRPFRPACPCPV